MTFLAQFCFADSTDLFDALPGDILLVFSDGVYGKDWDEGAAGALRFEWVKRSEASLVEEGDIPKTRWQPFPVYGEIHRTKDYLTGDPSDEAWRSILLKWSKSPRDFVNGLGAGRALANAYKQSWCIEIIEGTKVGGLPRWIQHAEEIPGRFLCALGSIHPVFQTSADDPIHRPYPFTNFQGPFLRGLRVLRTAEEEIPMNRLLMWGDVGSLYLFLDDGGNIHWTIQSY